MLVENVLNYFRSYQLCFAKALKISILYYFLLLEGKILNWYCVFMKLLSFEQNVEK